MLNTATLRNRGQNGDSARDLYRDAIEMLKAVHNRLRYDPDECNPEREAREIEQALRILDGELELIETADVR